MKGLEIRQFRIEDTDGVLGVWESAGMIRPGRNPRADIQKKLGHSPESFFVGVQERQIVATVMVGYDGHRGWIYLLAVRPELQRKGIGRAMVEHVEGWLRLRGCLKAKLQIDEDRASVVGFYEKLGYEPQNLISMGRWFLPEGTDAVAESRRPAASRRPEPPPDA